MFFATLLPTVALGMAIQHQTSDRMGLTEYLISNSVTGVINAAVGPQPMLILNPTGPITAITEKISALADRVHVDYFVLYAATGLFVCIYLVITAACGWSRHIRYMTRFTYEIFGCFVCSIYVQSGIHGTMLHFESSAISPTEHFGSALFSAVCAVATCAIALWLSGARRWKSLPVPLLGFLADYGLTISVVVVTLVSYWPRAQPVKRLEIFGDRFGPTCWMPTLGLPLKRVGDETAVCATRACYAEDHVPYGVDHRPWFVWSFEGSSDACIDILYTLGLGALIALPISFFFYMDQNISSLLCQLPELKLKRGHYYHSSCFAIGIFNGVAPAFGCPFVTGSLPQSPQMVRALTDEHGRVVENRLAPLVCHALLILPLAFPWILESIPEAAMNGLLMFSGVEGIIATDLWQRFTLLLAPKHNLPIKWRSTSMRSYTCLQLLVLATCWIIQVSPFGLFVSLIIVSLIPFRIFALPCLFKDADLLVLDEAVDGVRTEDRQAANGLALADGASKTSPPPDFNDQNVL